MGEDEKYAPVMPLAVPGGPAPVRPAPDPALAATVSGLAYGGLAALGTVVGVFGSFSHTLTLGAVPVALILLLAVNLVGPWLAGWAMGGRLGGLVPAAAWVLVVVLMSDRRAEGDLVIAGTWYGYGFIIGGMAAAGAAVMLVPAPGAKAVRP